MKSVRVCFLLLLVLLLPMRSAMAVAMLCPPAGAGSQGGQVADDDRAAGQRGMADAGLHAQHGHGPAQHPQAQPAARQLQHDHARHAHAPHGQAQHGHAQHGHTQHGNASHELTQHEQAQQEQAQHGQAQHDQAQHAQAQQAAEAGAGHHGTSVDAQERCDLCSSFCSATPLVGSVPTVCSPPASAAVVFDDIAAPAPSFLSDGQERPPRSI